MVIESDEEAQKAVEELKGEKILGFDTETRAAFRKGERYRVSLLQLATDSKAYLFRLNKLKNFTEIFKILSDPQVIKTGVAIKDDIKALKKKEHFVAENFLDLALVAKKMGIEKFGLRALTAVILKKRLSKKAKISNWEKDKLSPAQIDYAACDAAVGFDIYKRIFDD